MKRRTAITLAVAVLAVLAPAEVGAGHAFVGNGNIYPDDVPDTEPECDPACQAAQTRAPQETEAGASAGAGPASSVTDRLSSTEPVQPPATGPASVSFESDPAVLKGLLLALFTADDEQRGAALRNLGLTRDLRIVPVLKRFVSHRSQAVRQAAIEAAGLLSDPGVTDWLTLLARGDDPAGRLAAIDSLAAQGTPEALDALYDIGLGSKDDPAAKHARLTLRKRFPDRLVRYRGLRAGLRDAIPEGVADGELAELLAALEDRSLPARRREAALSLARLGDGRAVPALLVLVREHEPEVGRIALDALAGLAVDRSSHALNLLAGSMGLDFQKRIACARALIAHDTPLAATLALDLWLNQPDLFDQPDLRQATTELVERRLPGRATARRPDLTESDPAAEVELLLDMLQRESDDRHRLALNRTETLRPAILPAVAAHLHQQTYALVAIRTLAAYRSPEARAVLAGFIASDRQSLELRLQAVESIARDPDPAVVEQLAGLHAASADESLRIGIRKALTEWHPEEADRVGLAYREIPPPNRSGVIPLAVALGLHGGGGMYLVSESANPSGGSIVWLPAVGGVVLGAGSAILLTLKEEEFSLPQFAWVTTGGLWGMYEAAMLALSFDTGGPIDPDLRRIGLAGMFLGQTAGITAAWLTRNGIGRDIGQQVYMNTALAFGALGGFGLALQRDERTTGWTAAWLFGGSTAGLLASGLLARELHFEPVDYFQTANSASLGALLGLQLAAAAGNGGGASLAGGALAGSALGFAAGSLASAFTSPTAGDLLALDGAFLTGAMAGLGAALQKESRTSRWTSLWTLGGSAAGMLAGGLLVPHLHFEPVDYFQTANSAGLGALIGLQLAAAAGNGSGASLAGGALAGSALGFTAGSLASAFTSPTAGDLLALDGAFLTGAMAGLGAALQMEGRTSRWTSLWTLGGSTAGMVTGGLLAPHLHLQRTDWWQVAATSLISSWTGYLTAAAIQPDRTEPAPGGALLGASLGFTAGAVLGHFTEPEPLQVAFHTASFAVGNLAGLGMALQWGDRDRQATSLWLLGGGVLGAAASLGLAHEFLPSRADLLQIGGLSLLTGWSGYWGLRAIRPGHATAGWGGAALGVAAGYAAGALLSPFIEPTTGEVLWAGGGFGLGSLFGAGLGLAIPGLSESALDGIMLAGGWVGFGSMLAAEPHIRLSTGDIALLGLGSSWGIYQGLAIAEVARSGGIDSDRGTFGAAMLGASSGLIVAGTLSQFIEPEPADIGRWAIGGIIGSAIGNGIGLLVPELDRRLFMSTAMSGGWAGLIAYATLVPPATFTGADYLALVAGTGWGTWQGWMIGRAAGLDDRQTAGAMVLGSGLGYLAGDIFARASDLSFRQVIFSQLAGYAGSGMGAGVALMSDAGTTAIGAATAATGWAAQLAVGAFAHRMEFRPNDTWEYLIGQGYGTWHGLAIAQLLDVSERRGRGAMLAGLSAGFIVPMVTNQLQDYSAFEDLMMLSGIAFGAWIGGWGAYAASGAEWDAVVTGVLTGGDAGLLLSAVPMIDALGVSGSQLGWIELTGVAGMALGSSGTAIFSNTGRSVAAGMAAGAGAGLVAGVIWTTLLREWIDRPAGTGSAAVASSLRTADRRPRLSIGRLTLPEMAPCLFWAPPVEGRGLPPVPVYGVQGVLD